VDEKNPIYLGKGQKAILIAQFFGGTILDLTPTNWTSSASSVIKINEDEITINVIPPYSQCPIKAEKEGTADITVTSQLLLALAIENGVPTKKAKQSASKTVQVKVNDKPVKPTIRPRSDWNPAPKPSNYTYTTRTGTTRVIFHHQAGQQTQLVAHIPVAEQIKSIQSYHISIGWGDIGYHFIIDRNGVIWEARSMDYRGTHSGSASLNQNIGVCLLGNFEPYHAQYNPLSNPDYPPDELSQAQKDAMIALSRWLVHSLDLKVVTTGGPANQTPISTHNEVDPNRQPCPGQNARPWVQNDLRTLINNWRGS
jgi:hypothetical protein